MLLSGMHSTLYIELVYVSLSRLLSNESDSKLRLTIIVANTGLYKQPELRQFLHHLSIWHYLSNVCQFEVIP